ncbi:hypothetical protein BKA67DRAFT_543489 [Truncatella angustata]|uniref:Ribosomal protein S21 n=1 Tax=Truncatella angustata TaxID=152316 RepID=A0A9P9A3M6_9PEZI|nr:uncharacterized protein BKA67DRAFT_543489 [Truncatella angustata]KAH6659074.1 hypothetical protein BKA67DRAFT_543489 [Truncatella angustata]
MATELGRVANAALRSARLSPSFLSTPSSRRQLPSSALASAFHNLSIDSTHKRYASAWTSPSRSAKSAYAPEDADVTKPTTTPQRPWRSSAATPVIPDPETAKPEPAFDDEDIVRDYTFNIGDLTSNRSYSDSLTSMTTTYPDIRCVPRTGRSVQVGKGADAARTLKLLNMQCAANRVRQDFQSQRFHERPGLKRKRLKSERWRRRFKKAFKATCKRVDELRRQGW